jgi:hypothetical protein
MSVKSGLGGQLMYADESTYGTYAAPTKSLEMVSETLKLTIGRIDSKGIRAGRRLVGKWQPGKRSAGGDVDLEVAGTGFGGLLKHCLGGIATTGPGPNYTHTATVGDLPVGFTAQVGRPDITGTVNPFTYLGCRVNTWDLSVKAGELLMLKPTVVAADETTAQTLGTFADPSGPLLSYVGGLITVGGTEVDLLDFAFKGDNKLDGARFRLRGSALIKQPLENSWREITGALTADFEGLTQYNHFVNADEVSLVATFNGPLIAGGGGAFYAVVITANVRFDGQTPNVAGPAVLTQPLQVTVVGSGATDALAFSAAYTTTDATP